MGRSTANPCRPRISALTTPAITLQSGSAVSFASKYDIETNYDAGIVEVATGPAFATWTKLAVNYPDGLAFSGNACGFPTSGAGTVFSKNDFAAAAIRTSGFWANDALFHTRLIAYNLLNCIRRLGLPRALATARLKRVGLLLLQLPANVIHRSRQLWIKIKRDHPMRLVFYHAMAALQ